MEKEEKVKRPTMAFEDLVGIGDLLIYIDQHKLESQSSSWTPRPMMIMMTFIKTEVYFQNMWYFLPSFTSSHRRFFKKNQRKILCWDTRQVFRLQQGVANQREATSHKLYLDATRTTSNTWGHMSITPILSSHMKILNMYKKHILQYAWKSRMKLGKSRGFAVPDLQHGKSVGLPSRNLDFITWCYLEVRMDTGYYLSKHQVWLAFHYHSILW